MSELTLSSVAEHTSMMAIAAGVVQPEQRLNWVRVFEFVMGDGGGMDRQGGQSQGEQEGIHALDYN